jgi:hypothetical protein
VADGWCWFVLREKYCWLVAEGWFVLREKYYWLVADKTSEQGGSHILVNISWKKLGFGREVFYGTQYHSTVVLWYYWFFSVFYYGRVQCRFQKFTVLVALGALFSSP